MSETVIIATEGRTGVITLNRPQAINALTREMIDAVTGAVQRFEADDDIAAILIEGAGERGFSAGGDVRAVRELIIDGDMQTADQFFEAEYRLNRLIANATKPVIALTSGVVMGGGIGLAAHAGYRISADNGRFAMPEAGIGFFCDVGVNAILAKAPRNRALAFELSGRAVGAEDARALGLSDCVISADKLADFRADLLAALEDGDVATSVVSQMQAYDISGGATPFIALADKVAAAFDADDLEAALERLANMAETDDEAKALLDEIESRSPLSLVAIWDSHIFARAAKTVDQVLDADRKLARFIIRQPDFAEGVRAVLVDKDHAPKWSSESVSPVLLQEIAKCLSL